MTKVLMKGNEALAASAIKGGCKYYFGYPITPQNEITEYMAREMPKIGGAFVQAESELAAINMVYGAACAGGRALTSSSSPGIALMQEGISFLCSVDLPCVLMNISRGGPGIGSIQPGQADYYQATKGGGNGDYHVIVYAPSSIQEGIDLTVKAFDIADKYRNPVMILADGMLGQMMEPVELPEETNTNIPIKDWALTSTKGKRKPNTIKSLLLIAEELEARNLKQKEKYDIIVRDEVKYELYNMEDAEIVFAAFGTTARIVKEAIEILGDEGIKAGLIRPITLWPYPFEAFDKIGEKAKAVLTVELNFGQMLDDVKIAVNGRLPVHFCGKTGGIIISSEEIVCEAKKILGGGK